MASVPYHSLPVLRVEPSWGHWSLGPSGRDRWVSGPPPGLVSRLCHSYPDDRRRRGAGCRTVFRRMDYLKKKRRASVTYCNHTLENWGIYVTKQKALTSHRLLLVQDCGFQLALSVFTLGK